MATKKKKRVSKRRAPVRKRRRRKTPREAVEPELAEPDVGAAPKIHRAGADDLDHQLAGERAIPEESGFEPALAAIEEDHAGESEDGSGNTEGRALNGTALVAAAEFALAILVRNEGTEAGVTPRADETSFTAEEKQALDVIAPMAAEDLGFVFDRIPFIAPILFGLVFSSALSARTAAIRARRTSDAPGPVYEQAGTRHAQEWGRAAPGVPQGTEPKRSGFPPPFRDPA